MLRYVPTVLVIGLAIYCLIDCFQSSNETVRNLPKLVWALLIVLLPLFGSIGWLVAGRPAGNPRPGSGGPRRGPQGPDDDPDFLRGLGGPTGPRT